MTVDEGIALRRIEGHLTAPIPWGERQHTVLQQTLILTDHNAYHLGQLVSLRRLLGAWPPA